MDRQTGLEKEYCLYSSENEHEPNNLKNQSMNQTVHSKTYDNFKFKSNFPFEQASSFYNWLHQTVFYNVATALASNRGA